MKYVLFMNSNYVNCFPTYELACDERERLWSKFKYASIMIISYDELEIAVYGEK